ncbi:MAG: ADP-ribosylglycohydrolase family protein [Phycisphaerae bacterium]|nr:ADP-ribosylglycohydrolase family protein [Phycisphaerae bacterium]
MLDENKSIGRRSFLKGAAVLAAAVSVPKVFAAEKKSEEKKAKAELPMKSKKSTAEAMALREKFFGCIAGCHIGSAMGAPVESWSWEKIEKEYGTLDKLLPYHHYGTLNTWDRVAGTTEDGVERQKLMITAIMEKQDRINAEDLRRAWINHMNPKAGGLVSEPFEDSLLAMAKTPVPASDIGKYCDYSGLVSLSRSCHPIGLINAGDISGAIDDVREIGQLYNTANSRGIFWGEVTVIAIAAATKPNATVDSVIGAIFDNYEKTDKRFAKQADIRWELDKALKLTAGCKDFRDMRKKFDTMYSGEGVPYAHSYANEIVSKAVCVFKMTKANTWEAMKAGVNMGRDTDCLTAVAAGISGALTGAGSIPEALIKQADYATSVNPHTNSKRLLRENSDGLYNAFKARLAKMKTYIQDMERA